jgi:hypothetical protein
VTTLTNRQMATLLYMESRRPRETSGYSVKSAGVGNISTIRQLADKGLVRPVGQGHEFCPTTAGWVLTKEGRAVALRNLTAQWEPDE